MAPIRRDLGIAFHQLVEPDAFGNKRMGPQQDARPDPRADIIARLMQQEGALSNMPVDDFPEAPVDTPMSEQGYTDEQLYRQPDLERVFREFANEQELERRRENQTYEEIQRMMRDSTI